MEGLFSGEHCNGSVGADYARRDPAAVSVPAAQRVLGLGADAGAFFANAPAHCVTFLLAWVVSEAVGNVAVTVSSMACVLGSTVIVQKLQPVMLCKHNCDKLQSRLHSHQL